MIIKSTKKECCSLLKEFLGKELTRIDIGDCVGFLEFGELHTVPNFSIVEGSYGLYILYAMRITNPAGKVLFRGYPDNTDDALFKKAFLNRKVKRIELLRPANDLFLEFDNSYIFHAYYLLKGGLWSVGRRGAEREKNIIVRKYKIEEELFS